MTEAELISAALRAAPSEYRAVLSCEQSLKGNGLKLDDLEKAMTRQWRQERSSQHKDDDNDDEGGEVALSAFHGTCFKCKQKGHKADKCPKGNKGSTTSVEKQKNTHKFSGKCFNCGKTGHRSVDCWEKDENKAKRPKGYKIQSEKGSAAVDTVEFVLTSSETMAVPEVQELLDDPNIWIGDSGATVHMTPHGQGLVNTRTAKQNESVTMGNKMVEKAQIIGDLHGAVCDKYGTVKTKTVLQDVAYVPTSGYNLFSLTKAMKSGWELRGDNETGIVLTKGNQKVCFDIRIPTPKGVLFAMYHKRETECGNVGKDGGTVANMTYAQAHNKLGHCSAELTRKIAKQMGWHITTPVKPCEACSVAKAKQKNVPKESGHGDNTDKAGRVFLDISTVKRKEDDPPVTKPNWRILVDERTQLKFSEFFKRKNDMIEPTCELFHKWKQAGKVINTVRLDNAGENKLLKKRCESKDWKLDIHFEFTARDTPQQNSLAEVSFATVASRGRALMIQANIPYKLRYKVWTEAFATATLLDGMVPIMLDGKLATRYEHWAGENPAFVNYLRTWGEAGTVKVKTKNTPKLADRGVPCMFVGYALNHPGDCYRMWNPETNRVHETRDVIWMKRMFFPKTSRVYEIQKENGADIDVDFVGEAKTHQSVEAGEGSSSNEMKVDDEANAVVPQITRTGRTVKPPTRLIEEMGTVGYEIALTSAERNYYEAMRAFPEEQFQGVEFACVGAGLGGGFENTEELRPLKYDEAMATEDKRAWERAVDEEYQRIKDYDVFKPIPRSNVPEGSKILTSTWSMKKKASGVFRARLTARGYEQVDGIHYDENAKSAPVVNGATINIVFILMLMAGWVGELLDVRGAFLHGEFEKNRKVYMEVPQGFEKHYKGNVVLLLLKTLYGTKQAAMAFWRKLVEAFHKIGFNRSKADPCLYFSWTSDGLIIWTSWVDDCFVCGKKEGVDKAKKLFKGQFDCDEVGELKEYIGCKVDIDRSKRCMKLTQPVLLQSYKDEFELPQSNGPKTPAVPGEVLQPCEEENQVSNSHHRMYRKGVGKLLHMMRWTRPEILNAVRELSRFMGGASWAHMKAMYRTMNYCVSTPNRGLILNPDQSWDGNADFEFTVKGRADSDYANDPERRRSVSGYSTFLCGAPVTMKSRMQSSVTLSVTEAELVSGTQCAQDMLFIMRVLESLGLKVKKPMFLEMDNKGAIDLVHTWSVGGYTRHDSIRQNFLRELREENVIEVKWIPTDDNSSDLFTKNLPGPLFNKHTAVYCGIDEYMTIGDSQGEGVGVTGLGIESRGNEDPG